MDLSMFQRIPTKCKGTHEAKAKCNKGDRYEIPSVFFTACQRMASISDLMSAPYLQSMSTNGFRHEGIN